MRIMLVQNITVGLGTQTFLDSLEIATLDLCLQAPPVLRLHYTNNQVYVTVGTHLHHNLCGNKVWYAN